jgi:hypothetical protein
LQNAKIAYSFYYVFFGILNAIVPSMITQQTKENKMETNTKEFFTPPPTTTTPEEYQAIDDNKLKGRFADVSRGAVRALVQCYDGPDSIIPGNRSTRPDEGPQIANHRCEGYQEASDKVVRCLLHQMTLVLGGGDRINVNLMPSIQGELALSNCRQLVAAWDREEK